MKPKAKLSKSKPSSGKSSSKFKSYCLSLFLLYLIQIFRESEAQTDPFTPEYVIEKDNAPEVLTI